MTQEARNAALQSAKRYSISVCATARDCDGEIPCCCLR